MANVHKRLSTNVDGQFYVDSTCINCDTCRQLAPRSFEEQGDYSTVFRQPTTKKEMRDAYQALLACPVGSIGDITPDKQEMQEAMESFPIRLDESVYYNGFNSEKSFGANSYFIQHPDGNWLIDSPRYVKKLLSKFEQMGGIRTIFLSHEDDVAEAKRYATHFGATRIIHQADQRAQPDAEWIIQGNEAVEASSDFLIIPVPGHTPGSMVLLYKNQYLFAGDHLWWDPHEKALGMPAVYIWNHHDLIHSTERLAAYQFEWVLPGHGHRVRLPPSTMKHALQALLGSRQPTI